MAAVPGTERWCAPSVASGRSGQGRRPWTADLGTSPLRAGLLCKPFEKERSMPHQNTTSSDATAQNGVGDKQAPNDQGRDQNAAAHPGPSRYAAPDLADSTLAPPAAPESSRPDRARRSGSVPDERRRSGRGPGRSAPACRRRRSAPSRPTTSCSDAAWIAPSRMACTTTRPAGGLFRDQRSMAFALDRSGLTRQKARTTARSPGPRPRRVLSSVG